MSNKPKIYGYCPAGCKYETIHRSELEQAAALIKQNVTNGHCYLEIGKQYKIFGRKDTNTGFDFSITFLGKINDNSNLIINFTIPNDDKYATSVVFKLLEASIGSDGLTLVYEMSGVRYTLTEAGVTALLDKEYLYVENAEQVYLYNDDASLILDGKSGLSIYSTSSTVYNNIIPIEYVSIPDGRVIQVGDFLLCADGNLYLVTSFDYEGTKITTVRVEEYTSIPSTSYVDNAINNAIGNSISLLGNTEDLEV